MQEDVLPVYFQRKSCLKKRNSLRVSNGNKRFSKTAKVRLPMCIPHLWKNFQQCMFQNELNKKSCHTSFQINYNQNDINTRTFEPGVGSVIKPIGNQNRTEK